MSSDTLAIRIRDLSKCYEIYVRPQDRLKQSIHPRLQRLVGREPKNYYREFWALKDVSFEVNRGEAVGIIGRNGAGKSTLLQLVCGTLNPTGGSVEVNGTVSALLELGSGFNPEFTGRENVFVNAQILGLSHEATLNRFDDIASFADIGDFIDQPVKTYSSGMMMRLAFAVQTAVDPKILIVDEALSVGDMFFQAKCMARINKLVDSGVALLFVSHDVSVVRQICRRAVLLDGGKAMSVGAAAYVTDQYVKHQLEERNRSAKKMLEAGKAIQPQERVLESSSAAFGAQSDGVNPTEICQNMGSSLAADVEFGREAYQHRSQYHRMGNGDAEIINVQMLRQGEHRADFDFDDMVLVRIFMQCYKNLVNLNQSIQIRTVQGVGVAFFDTRLQHEMSRQYTAGNLYLFEWKIKLPLLHGNYVLACALTHPPITAGQDWQFVDAVPIAYEFRVAPRQAGMIDGFVTLPAELSITSGYYQSIVSKNP